jgi:hypothetical protein
MEFGKEEGKFLCYAAGRAEGASAQPWRAIFIRGRGMAGWRTTSTKGVCLQKLKKLIDNDRHMDETAMVLQN